MIDYICQAGHDAHIQCDRTAELVGLFTQLFHSPHDEGKVALIGSGCPGATEATAEISSYFNIMLVTTVQ